LNGFVARLQHTQQQELEIAMGEVAKICALRLRDLLEEAHTDQDNAINP